MNKEKENCCICGNTLKDVTNEWHLMMRVCCEQCYIKRYHQILDEYSKSSKLVKRALDGEK